ncbi:SPOR domain-containing protein [Ectothiorhodospiraceae bacterium 2226]|nr:SPOR domain-containing protein [Ectothiorhodospiraceae bacterium 2226]
MNTDPAHSGALAGAALPPSPRPFLDQGRSHLLDILQHLVDYSAQVLLVAAPAGRGKSVLAAELATRCSAHGRVCCFQAEPDLTAELLLQHLAHTLVLSEAEAVSGAALEAALFRMGEQAVLVVDDADRLPPEALAVLLAFGREADEEPPPAVRVVLFADEHLELPPICVQRLTLAPFTPAQVAAYVEHRLEVLDDPPVFDRAQIARLHHLTGGNPGDIERELAEIVARGGAEPYGRLDRLRDAGALVLARVRAWRDRLPVGALRGARSPGGARDVAPVGTAVQSASTVRAAIDLSAAKAWLHARASVGVGAAITFAILVAVVLILPRGAVEEPAVPVARAPDATTPERPEARVAPAVPEAAPRRAPAGPPIVQELPLPPRADAPAQPRPAQPTVAAPGHAAAAQPEPAATDPDPASAVAERPMRAAGGWLAERDPEHYTLQLAAGGRSEALRAYAARQPLDGEAALIAGMRDGAPWYTLVFGAFADRAAAEAARDRLQTQLEIPPWPRRIGSLEGEGEVVAVSASSPSPGPRPTSASAGGAAPGEPAPDAGAITGGSEPAASSVGSAGRGMVWLWAQDQAHYTLQLTASGSEAAVRELIAREGIERHAAYFTTARDDQPWYVLIYGSYPSAEAARAAVADLPAALREAGPWPRTFASVQRSVRLD